MSSDGGNNYGGGDSRVFSTGWQYWLKKRKSRKRAIAYFCSGRAPRALKRRESTIDKKYNRWTFQVCPAPRRKEL